MPTAVGIFLGGFFIHAFKPRPRILTSFLTLVELLGGAGIILAFFLGCPQSNFAGEQIGNQLSSI